MTRQVRRWLEPVVVVLAIAAGAVVIDCAEPSGLEIHPQPLGMPAPDVQRWQYEILMEDIRLRERKPMEPPMRYRCRELPEGPVVCDYREEGD